MQKSLLSSRQYASIFQSKEDFFQMQKTFFVHFFEQYLKVFPLSEKVFLAKKGRCSVKKTFWDRVDFSSLTD